MKKIILFPIFFIVAIQIANALIVEPSSLDLIVFQGQENKYEIIITNSDNFIIYNISFTNNSHIIYPFIEKLEINQSVKKNITVKSSAIFPKTQYTSTAKFFYFADITLPATTYNVNINDSAFTPIRLDIVLGDSVRWLNNGSLSHTITHSTFDDTLQPNQSITKTFNSEAFIDYHDTNIGFHGFINISKRAQQFVTNPDFNKNFVVNLESKPIGTTIEAQLIPKDYNVRHNHETEGLVRVKNNGNDTAVNLLITTDSNWISFAENQINMTPEQNKFIIFKLTPLLKNITESNKTYEFNIKVQGDNTNQFSDTIKVFVPYEDTLSATNETIIEDCIIENTACWLARKAFCEAFPYSPACDPAPKKEIVEKIVYRELDVPFNYTPRDIASFLTRLTGIEDSLTKTNKFVNDKVDNIEKKQDSQDTTSKELKDLLNQSVSLAKENSQRASNITIAILSTSTAILLISSVITIAYLLRKQKQKKRTFALDYPK